jgi:glycosyltransferase involved in cell wall biosynthesis
MASSGVASYKSIQVLDIDLTSPPQPMPPAASSYHGIRATIRIHGVPVGEICLPPSHASDEATIRALAIDRLAWPILRQLLIQRLARQGGVRPADADDLIQAPLAETASTMPTLTVAVCTRDRPDDIQRCLAALERLDPPADEILVVDNAPRTAATREIVAGHPRVRYVCEPTPGLDWARNRAIDEARGDVIAYTDDDVVVDSGWAGALKRAFRDAPDASAVTGLVLPFELETRAQQLFEEYGGFGRGFVRRVYGVDESQGERAVAMHGGTGKFGTGANMAFRRSIFADIGGFDPALDVGTVTNGGGDLDMFFRILREGHTLVYEPAALVRHRHRRDQAALVRQIQNNGIGFYSYICRNAFVRPEDRGDWLRLGLWWFWHWDVRRVLLSIIQPGRVQRDLSVAELIGSLRGIFRYQRARREALALKGAADPAPSRRRHRPPQPRRGAPSIGVAQVDLSQPLVPIAGADQHARVRVFVMWHGVPLGVVEIPNGHRPLPPARLRDAIVDGLGINLLEPAGRAAAGLWTELVASLRHRFAPSPAQSRPRPSRLDPAAGVSIVLPTRNRPADLARCLESLSKQVTSRDVEIVVVDNDPASGETAPVVARFPMARLVPEFRKGLSYARNAGILASRHELIVATDDDVTMPEDWLERLVAPFRDPSVMVVTGNVFPVALDTPSQQIFEAYGGLGKGFEAKRADGAWFWQFRGAVPTWDLGATANAAFRATIFAHPDIGPFDEALGAGMPTGCSEDTYVFYKVLKAGFSIVYEPRAYVWHRHRSDLKALRRQIYSYAKGHVAYHVTTLQRDRDWRALGRLCFRLPQTYARRVLERLRGRSDYPLTFIGLEVLGSLAGPFALYRARRRVRRLGRSAAVACFPERHEHDVHVESASPENPAGELVVALRPESTRAESRPVQPAA